MLRLVCFGFCLMMLKTLRGLIFVDDVELS
jgi:hypothetical protein